MLSLLVAAPALAQESAREAAERVHEEGRYPSDVTPLIPESAAGTGSSVGEGEGAGRGPRGETTLGEREAGDRGTGDGGPLGGVIRQILQWFDGLAQLVGGPLAWVILALGLVLVVMLAAYVAVRMRLGMSASEVQARPSGDDGAIDPMLLAPSLSADELAAQARWGEAIHALFLDALGRIGGHEGRLRGRTARELVTRVPAARTGRGELGELLELTELVWFGGRPATEEQYQRARGLAASVPASAGSGVGGTGATDRGDPSDRDPGDRDPGDRDPDDAEEAA